jgi:hypothetical protein
LLSLQDSCMKHLNLLLLVSRLVLLNNNSIAVALTIEPGRLFAKENEEDIFSPPCRLRALQIVHGYFLPDPDTPNRLTVWFTGGKLSPAPAPPEDVMRIGTKDDTTTFGGFEEWVALFGAEHKRTWGESLSIMGAKLFLGAELPPGMGPDGTMSYTLHRPYGGHGKGYVDVSHDIYIFFCVCGGAPMPCVECAHLYCLFVCVSRCSMSTTKCSLQEETLAHFMS